MEKALHNHSRGAVAQADVASHYDTINIFISISQVMFKSDRVRAFLFLIILEIGKVRKVFEI